MKKYLYKLLLIAFVICFVSSFISCSKPAGVSGIDSKTKNYYLRNGYVNFSISDDLSVGCDDMDNIINFDDGTSMIKEKTIISITPKSDDFILNEFNYYINLKTDEILSGLKINNKTYLFTEKDFSNYIVTSSIKIESLYSNFDIVGFCCLVDKKSNIIGNANSLDEIILVKDEIFINKKFSDEFEIFYAYLNNLNFLDVCDHYNFEANIVFDFKFEANSKIISMSFDIEFNENKFKAFVILKDKENNLYLSEMNFVADEECFMLNNEKNGSEIDEFKLFFDTNIEINDEYYLI